VANAKQRARRVKRARQRTKGLPPTPPLTPGAPDTASVPDPVALGIPRPAAGRAVVRSGLLSMLALVSLGVTRLVHGSLVTHAASKARYAEVVTLIAVATITSLALPAGVASAMSKFIPYQRGRGAEPAARGVYRYLSRLGGGASLAFGLLVGLITPHLLGIGVRDAVLVGLLTFTFSVYSFDKAALYGFDRVGAYTRLELSTGVLTIGTTVALIATGWQGYLFPLVLGYGVFVLGTRLLLRRDISGPVAPHGAFDRREVTVFVGLACAGTLASTGFLQGTTLLAHALSRDEVAYFGAAVALVSPMYFLPRALNLALFPAMAHAQGAGDLGVVRRHTDTSTRALFVLLAPLFGIALLVSREVLVLFGSEKFAPGTIVLQLMLGATYLSVVQVACVNALSSGSQRQVRVPVTSAVIGAAVGLVLAFALSRPLGATGIALAYLLGTAVIAGGPIVVTWRLHRMDWVSPVARSLAVLACAGVGAVWLDRLAATGLARYERVAVVAVIFVGLATVLAYSEVRSLLANARRRGAAGA
jgi:O-antigen/teichoic acid export membrane protein